MLVIKRTKSTSKDFIYLVKQLDYELKQRDGDEHAFFAQFNSIEALQNVILLYHDGKAIGCGAFKKYNSSTSEIKRMFVIPVYRGNGYASKILLALEKWSKELSYTHCILETGIKQPEAINLYKKNSYLIIPNYAPYTNIDTSICFKKKLTLDIEITKILAEETWPIRHKVMWPEQPLSFVKLPKDSTGVHYGLYVEGILTSIISLFENGESVQFRKFATILESQGQGYGSILLKHIIKEVSSKGIKQLWCNARVEKKEYYYRFGLKETAITYHKKGIDFVKLELIF